VVGLISWKRCAIEMLQHALTGSDNSYTAYLITAIVMTLSVLEGHSSIASLFKCGRRLFRVCGASHGPSASAELFVIISTVDLQDQPTQIREIVMDTCRIDSFVQDGPKDWTTTFEESHLLLTSSKCHSQFLPPFCTPAVQSSRPMSAIDHISVHSINVLIVVDN